MPSANTPTVKPGTADTTTDSANVGFSLDDQVFRINPQEVESKLSRKLVSLVSSFPERGGPWRYCAHTYRDDRTRGALTLRFQSKKPDNIALEPKAQDTLRAALHAQLSKMLPQGHQLPRISFDSLESPEGQTFGLIDLVFPQLKAFMMVQPDLKTIEVGVDGKKRLYTTDYYAGPIAGSTFILDCLNLPANFDDEAFFAALSSATRDLGALVGLAKIVYYEENSDFQADSGTVRAYLELNRPWLAAPLAELVQRLPSHLLWHGVPHKLLYIGHDLHKTPKYSADYPLSEAELAAAETSGRRISRETTTSDDDDSSSPSTSKKRKTAGK